jgi:type I restriction enzyme R subunit
MMDHVSRIETLGKRYFGTDRDFKSNLDRSARRAAWRMIRREEGWDDL